MRSSGFSGGERLPTESELVDLYGVSRQTVRRAFLDLVAAGLVERIRGKGTFAAARGRYLRSFGSVDDLMALSEDTELEIVSPIQLGTHAEAAVKLGLQFDQVLQVTYRRLHRELPFCLTTVFLPPHYAALLRRVEYLTLRGARAHATILAILDKSLPQPIAGSKQTITAEAAPDSIARWIDCEPLSPILKIDRIHFDREGRPVEFCVNHFNPERYIYTLQLKRDQAIG